MIPVKSEGKISLQGKCCHTDKRTTIERGIQFLQEIAMLELFIMTWLICSYPQIQMKPNSHDPQDSNLCATHHHCIPTDWQHWPGETKRHQPRIKWLNTSNKMKAKEKSCSLIFIWTSISAFNNKHPFDQEEGCRKYTHSRLPFSFTCGTTDRTWGSGTKRVASISSILEDSQYERVRHNQVKLPEQNYINELSCSSYQCSAVSKCKITLLSTLS